MRTAMLTRELLNKRHRTIPVRVGRAIASERLAKQPDNAKLATFLRLSTLRQYLKLGGRLACFNVDESFSGVVDGLIVVDLLRTAPKVLQKYMGREQAAAFIACTREQARTPADTHAVS